MPMFEIEYTEATRWVTIVEAESVEDAVDFICYTNQEEIVRGFISGTFVDFYHKEIVDA